MGKFFPEVSGQFVPLNGKLSLFLPRQSGIPWWISPRKAGLRDSMYPKTLAASRRAVMRKQQEHLNKDYDPNR
jgi:hypothetical protein